MIEQASVQTTEAPIGWAIGQVQAGAKRMAARTAEMLAACASAWEAESLYAELSRLSDAELARRGIPRGELHRCVLDTLGK